MGLEERNDHVTQFREPCHAISAEIGPVVVMSPVVGDVTTAEDLSELFQDMPALGGLDNRELRLYLPA